MFARHLAFGLVLMLGIGVAFPDLSGAQGPCDGEEDPPPECFVVSVTPNQGTVTRTIHTGPHTQTFTVLNEGQVADWYTLSCSGSGPVTCTGTSASPIFLSPNQSTVVSATYTVGNFGTGMLVLTATGGTSTEGGPTASGDNDIIVAPPAGAPVMDTAPANFTKQDYGRCAAACFAAVHAQATVPYFSLDAPRNVTLVYNGDRVDPKIFVHVNARPDTTYGQTPSEYRLAIKVDGVQVTFLNGEQTLRFAYPGSTAPVRLGGQFNAASYATNVYNLDISVSAFYAPSTVLTNTFKSKLMVVNETASAVARGWTVGGIQRLYVQGDGSVLITEGDGSAVHFRNVGGVVIAPAGEFSQVIGGTPGGGSGWTRRYPDSTKVAFNTAGRMIEVRDRFNNITTVTYDGSNRVWQVKDPLNLAITLTYDANGLDAITDPMGRVTQVTVDASKRLTAIQDPDLVSTAFGYDGSFRLSTITNRRGHTTTLAYDAQSGKLATITAPSISYVGTNGADSTGSPVTTLAAWHKLGVPYGSTGTPVNAPRADTVFGRVTDPAGHVTRFTVNRWGTPVQMTDPAGYITTLTYELNGLPIRTLYPTGGKDTLVYDASGLLTGSKSNQDSWASIRYAGWAQPDSTGGVGRPSVRSYIGPNGRVDSTKIGGARMRYRYDVRGRPDSVVDGENHLVRRTWYAGTNGNRSKDSLPGGRVTTYTYDSYGRRTTVTTPGRPTVTTFYSVINRTDSIRDGVNPVATRYGYNALYLTSVTDPKGQVYGFTANPLGWVTSRTDPVGRSDEYAYDRDGLPRRWTNRRGQAITATYDVLHRPLSKSGQNTDAVAWSYAPDGLSVTVSDPVSVVTEAYRVDGRLDSVRTQLVGQVYKVRYTYTVAGLLDSVVPSGAGLTFQTRRYGYHSTRFTPDTIKLGTLVTQTARNNDGQVTSVTFPGGDAVARRFTPVHSEADISSSASYGEAVTRYVGIDVARRIWRQILGNGLDGKEYAYDGLSRLAAERWIHYEGTQNLCHGADMDENGNLCTEPPSGWLEDSAKALVYDSAGNRRDKGGEYATGNRITTFDGCTYQADFDGNVTQRVCGAETVTFAWTAENRLSGFTVNGQAVQFRYDAAGRLIRKDVGGSVERHFLWNGQDLLAELNAEGTGKVAEYSYYPGLDNPHALIVGATTYHAHRDASGNVIALTDPGETVSRTYAYDPWGQSVGGTDYAGLGGADRARFKGALWLGPELDLYFMRARWYEPRTGRFLSEDPIGLAGGINPYVYVGNDPVNGADPMGTCEWKWVVDAELYYINEEGVATTHVFQHFECVGDSFGGLVGAHAASSTGGGPAAAGQASSPGVPGLATWRRRNLLESLVCPVLGAIPLTYSFGVAVDFVPIWGGVIGSGVFIGQSGLGLYKKEGWARGYDLSFGVEYAMTIGSYGGTATDIAVGTTTRGYGISENQSSGTMSTQVGPTYRPGSVRWGRTTTTPTAYAADCRQ